MTTSTLIEIFDILQDKYGSPYIDESETLKFLNMAQYERLNRLIPDDKGGQINFEIDYNVATNLKPFIWTVSGLAMTSGGVLANGTIQTALRTASGDTGALLHRILNVSLTSGGTTYPVKYTKHNNVLQNSRNYFKTPSVSNPRYTINGAGLQFAPASVSYSLALTLLKTPKEISLSVNPEWSDDNCYLILAIALQLAGVSTRDEELIQDIRNVKIAQ